MPKLFLILFLIGMSFSYDAYAQKDYDLWSSAKLFNEAKRLDTQNQRKVSRAVCYVALNKTNVEIPIRLFLAESYFADSMYSHARQEADTIFQIDARNQSAHLIKIDSYTLEKDYDSALAACNSGLAEHPTNIEILNRKARIYLKQNAIEDAENTAKEVLKLAPGNKEAKEVLEMNRDLDPDQKISAYYGLATLNSNADLAHWAGIRVAETIGFGIVSGGLNYNYFRPNHGVQFILGLQSNIGKRSALLLAGKVSPTETRGLAPLELSVAFRQKTSRKGQFQLGWHYFKQEGKTQFLEASLSQAIGFFWMGLSGSYELTGNDWFHAGGEVRIFFSKRSYLGFETTYGLDPSNYMNIGRLAAFNKELGFTGSLQIPFIANWRILLSGSYSQIKESRDLIFDNDRRLSFKSQLILPF